MTKSYPKRDDKYQKEFLRLNNLTEIAKETADMKRLNLAFLRPPFIQPFESKNTIIEGVTIKNSPFWNINPVFCQNITIKSVRIEATNPSPNTDGIDPDSCKDAVISNVYFDVSDDCIAIKSGRDGQGRRIGHPTENALITKCHMVSGHGGVSTGSEESGGVRNVTIKNSVIQSTTRGIYIKATKDRGGVVENVYVNNITVHRIKKEALGISLIYNDKSILEPLDPDPKAIPTFRKHGVPQY